MPWKHTEATVAEDGMSRAEELQMIEECLVSEVAQKLDPGPVQDLALLTARFVHLVREREAREDDDAWAAIVGDP